MRVSSLSASDTAAQVDRGLPELLARRRRVGFDADRQVVVVDRLPDFLGPAVLARVDAAHRALQLGELAHHVGGEVGLAQPARVSCARRQLAAPEHVAPRSTRASGSTRSALSR